MLRAPSARPLSRAYAYLGVALLPARNISSSPRDSQCRAASQHLNDRRHSHSSASSSGLHHILTDQAPALAAYVHLPFCKRRCYYCDFPVTVVGSKPEQPPIQQGMQDYIDLLCKEIQATVKIPGPPLNTVFFGGGTPTLVPPQLLKQVLTSLHDKYGIASEAEISMESDPGTFDVPRLQGYAIWLWCSQLRTLN